MMEFRILRPDEINRALFASFERRQEVTRCWRKINGQWQIKDVVFVDDWTETDYARLIACLRNTLQTGGLVLGAFDNGRLKGFASVESAPMGSNGDYLELSAMHVSRDMRGRGAGRALFESARGWARDHGAKKLYISGHSSVESQAFYRAMGCVEAAEYDREHVEKEPCDCQLECRV